MLPLRASPRKALDIDEQVGFIPLLHHALSEPSLPQPSRFFVTVSLRSLQSGWQDEPHDVERVAGKQLGTFSLADDVVRRGDEGTQVADRRVEDDGAEGFRPQPSLFHPTRCAPPFVATNDDADGSGRKGRS